MPRIDVFALNLCLLSLPMTAQPIRGWVYNNQPSSSGVPDRNYQFNSSRAVNTITYLSRGRYVVNLPGLAFSGGTVHVTAYGGNHYCKTAGWGPEGTMMQVFVNCFSPSGAAADGSFTALFYQQSRPDPYFSDAYLFANSSNLNSYTPLSAYQWNSTGATNTVTRSSTGFYQVVFPGIRSPGGTVMVTAYGLGAERCKTTSWYSDGSAIHAGVACYKPDGTPVDTPYTISYTTSLYGAGGDYYSAAAFAWTDQPSVTFYQPALFYQYNNASSDRITVRRTGLGSYSVLLPNQPPLNSTSAFVTAYGFTTDYCSISSWSASPGGTTVYVNCYNQLGLPIDSMFTVQYLTNFAIPG